jgi:hypothetical protein
MPDQNRESPFPTRVEGFCKRLASTAHNLWLVSEFK